MSSHNDDKKEDNENASKSDRAALVESEESSQEFISDDDDDVFDDLDRRVKKLEKKVHHHEMAFRNQKAASKDGLFGEPPAKPRRHKGKSSYGRSSDTIGFQHASHRITPVTLGKENASERYYRDPPSAGGTTDTRRFRENYSVPINRNDRHDGSNPKARGRGNKQAIVRDFKLMDTVHYLAQGEFAPRDDGVKLTPSREAVLSDIILEDVCRSHWPTVRLTRRGVTKHERGVFRTELQRQIDTLLRERITQMERRRRRHYRVLKMQNATPAPAAASGKTIAKNDVIVATNRHRHTGAGAEAAALCGEVRKDGEGASTGEEGVRRHRSEGGEPGPSRAAPRARGQGRPAPEKQNKKSALSKPTRENFSKTSSEADSRPRLLVAKKSPVRKRTQHDAHAQGSRESHVVPTISTRHSPSKYNQLYRIMSQNKAAKQNYSVNEKDSSTDDEPKRERKHRRERQSRED